MRRSGCERPGRDWGVPQEYAPSRSHARLAGPDGGREAGTPAMRWTRCNVVLRWRVVCAWNPIILYADQKRRQVSLATEVAMPGETTERDLQRADDDSSPHQFTLRALLLGVTASSLMFALVAWGGDVLSYAPEGFTSPLKKSVFVG